MKPWERYQQQESAPTEPTEGKPWERFKPERKKVYSGSIIPMSKYDDGEVEFDSDAGIVGSIKRAITTPRDVYEGKVDLNTEEGLGRVLESATVGMPINPAVRAGDRAIPGVARNMRQSRPPVPTSDELLDTAGRQYDTVRGMGVDYSSSSVKQLADTLKVRLDKDGMSHVPAPQTHKIIDELANPPRGSVASIENIESARRTLQHIAGSAAKRPDGGTEAAAAQRAIRELSAFIERADPQSVVAGPAAEAGRLQRSARQNYAAGKRSDELYGIERNTERRADAANSGLNQGNNIRSRLATMLRQKEPRPGKPMRGYTAEETAAIEAVNKGSKPVNALRFGSNVLGGGGGMAQIISGAAGAGMGSAAGGTAGAIIGGVVAPALGLAMRSGSNALTRSALRRADEMTRRRSALMAERIRNAPTEVGPTRRKAALMRALLLAGQGNEQMVQE